VQAATCEQQSNSKRLSVELFYSGFGNKKCAQIDIVMFLVGLNCCSSIKVTMNC
jgi:hypothetical protein